MKASLIELWRKRPLLLDWPHALSIIIPIVLFGFAVISPLISHFPEFIRVLWVESSPETRGIGSLVALAGLLFLLTNNVENSRLNAREKRELEGLLPGQLLFTLDAELPFYDQRIFRWAMRIPLYLSGFFTIILFSGDNSPLLRDFRFDTEGLGELLKLYQFSLYPLSAMITLGVVVARFHNSRYQKLQMVTVEAKNGFDRRFKHESEFHKYLSGYSYKTYGYMDEGSSNTSVYSKFQIQPRVYKIYFPSNTNDAFQLYCQNDVCVKLIEFVAKEVQSFYLGMSSMIRHNDYTRDNFKKELYSHLQIFIGRVQGRLGVNFRVDGSEISRDMTVSGMIKFLKSFPLESQLAIYYARQFMSGNNVGEVTLSESWVVMLTKDRNDFLNLMNSKVYGSDELGMGPRSRRGIS